MNTFNELTYPQQLLFALIKLALWNTAPDTTLLDRADDAVWNEVYRLSADQGIHAIVFDGVILLPIELQPSRTIKIAWAANVAAIERRYAQKVEVANDIVNHFTEKGISMLLFKGIGLAQYYPVPQHREFGDIDFYLFDRHEEGNRLLVGLGAVKHKYNIDKHVIFFYKGVPLENHAHFLAGEKFRNVDVLEKRLQKTLEDHSTLGRHAGSLVLFPPPDFNALFMICHAFGHFMSEPLVLRYLCDWALFLKANKGKIDFDAYRQAITGSHFMEFADAFTALAVKYLDLDPQSTPSFANNPTLESKILHELFYPLVFSKTKERSLKNIVSHKVKVLKSRNWKYQQFYPSQFGREILHSVIFHIYRPDSIMKLKK